ncbi:adenine phosphoribosyltransferase isoform X2 [Mustelus asterias]
MEALTIPPERGKSWYLALMAPNVKGPRYAWLDPSRLYCNQQAFKDCVEDLLQPFLNDTIDIVAGIDAMGFILGAAIAHHLGKGFLTIRKEGHSCIETKGKTYSDYTGRQKILEMRTDVVKPGHFTGQLKVNRVGAVTSTSDRLIEQRKQRKIQHRNRLLGPSSMWRYVYESCWWTSGLRLEARWRLQLHSLKNTVEL